MTLGSAFRITSLFLLLSVSAPACTPWEGSVDPLLGERLIEGAATRDYLWVRNDHGAVVEFRRSNRARRVLAAEGIVDMMQSGGRLLGVRRVDSQRQVFQVFDLGSGVAVSPSIALPPPGGLAPPIVLLADDGPTLFIERPVRDDAPTPWRHAALYHLEGGTWRPQDLAGTLFRDPRRPLISATSTNSGTIYIGYNQGEWGGGMWVIDPTKGTISEVTTDFQWDPSMPWSLPGDPPKRVGVSHITAVARDMRRPDCVFASEGLIHLGVASGRVLHVCGTEAVAVFSGPIPRDLTRGAPMTWPFYGIASTADGWVAVTPGFVFRSSRREVARTKLPRIGGWRMDWKSDGAEMIILISDANRAHSLSGYTPLLVPVTP